MHHVIVTRVSTVLCLMLVGCILGFALLTDRGVPVREGRAPTDSGAALFETHCGRCHGVGELAAALQAAPDRAARLREWTDFLEEHGRAGAAQDRVILEFLAERAQEARS